MNFKQIYTESTTPPRDTPGEDLAQKSLDKEALRQQRELWLQHPLTLDLLQQLSNFHMKCHDATMVMANDCAKNFSIIQYNLIEQRFIERTITYARTGSYTNS